MTIQSMNISIDPLQLTISPWRIRKYVNENGAILIYQEMVASEATSMNATTILILLLVCVQSCSYPTM